MIQFKEGESIKDFILRLDRRISWMVPKQGYNGSSISALGRRRRDHWGLLYYLDKEMNEFFALDPKEEKIKKTGPMELVRDLGIPEKDYGKNCSLITILQHKVRVSRIWWGP